MVALNVRVKVTSGVGYILRYQLLLGQLRHLATYNWVNFGAGKGVFV